MAYFANGTEGLEFEEQWCSRCVHSDHSGGREVGIDPPCPVWIAHQLYAYDLCNEKDHPGKVILDLLIPDSKPGRMPTCAMFHPIDAGAAIPGQLRIVKG